MELQSSIACKKLKLHARRLVEAACKPGTIGAEDIIVQNGQASSTGRARFVTLSIDKDEPTSGNIIDMRMR
jgi:hypothetical protein